MSYVSSLFASKNNPTKKGSDKKCYGRNERRLFFLWRKKVLKKLAESFQKVNRQYKIILKNYQNTKKRKRKEKVQTGKSEKNIKNNGTKKTEKTDTIASMEKV